MSASKCEAHTEAGTPCNNWVARDGTGHGCRYHDHLFTNADEPEPAAPVTVTVTGATSDLMLAAPTMSAHGPGLNLAVAGPVPSRPAVEVPLRPNGERPSKVGIIGYTRSRVDAPWDDPAWSFWGMNNMHLHVQGAPWEGWVDVHAADTIRADAAHLEWLGKAHPFPIWLMPQTIDRLAGQLGPSVVPFPVDGVMARFGRYMTNTVSWQAALAILCVEHAIGSGAAEIGIWGVDMAQGTEYAAQRPSCEHMIGIATGMGIKVTVPESSDLLKCAAPYGLGGDDALHAKLTERQQDLRERIGGARQHIAQLNAQVAEATASVHQMEGALETVGYLLGTWTSARAGGKPREANDIRAVGPPAAT